MEVKEELETPSPVVSDESMCSSCFVLYVRKNQTKNIKLWINYLQSLTKRKTMGNQQMKKVINNAQPRQSKTNLR